MFGFDAKEIFQQKVSDILILLVTIHLGTVMFAFVIKWIHPYLKNYAEMFNDDKIANSDESFPSNCDAQHKQRCKPKKKGKKTLFYNESDSDSSNEEYFNLVDNLKSFIDIGLDEIPSKSSNKRYTQCNMVDDIKLEIERAVNLKAILKDCLKKRKCSSEAQTSITINPKVKIDYSSPGIFWSHFSSEIQTVQNSESSDQFESASSGLSDAESNNVENEFVPVFRHLGCCNLLKQRRINCNITSKNIINGVNESLKTQSRNNPLMKSDLVRQEFGKQVSQENKILEMAITEFEKELKPIRDQIKLLKECLDGVYSSDTQCDLPSEFNSSITSTGTTGHSNCFSHAVSTLPSCSAHLYECFSSHHTFLEKKYDPFKAESKVNGVGKSINRMSETENSTGSPSTDKYSNLRHTRFEKNKKRSPLAEMYIKLSQCNSQTAYVLKNKKHITSQNANDNVVTCHINLNLNLGAIPTSGIQKINFLKERDMLPMLSEPEDVLGAPSNTHISLKPDVNPLNYS